MVKAYLSIQRGAGGKTLKITRMDRPIFLIGFMGSGKTTLGRKLAKVMSLPFVDMDQEIVQQIGMSITEYFSLYGEHQFRALEREVLHAQRGKNALISTGGGAPCYYDNMDWMLDHGTVVYLHHTPKSLWSRLSKSNPEKRPVLKNFTGNELLAFIEDKLAERSPYYDRAHIIIDQVKTSINQIATIVYAQHNKP